MHSVRITTRETGTVRGTARRPHFSLAIISVIVQLRIQGFWVRSVYFNVRNILPKFGTFPPPGHCVVVVRVYNYIVGVYVLGVRNMWGLCFFFFLSETSKKMEVFQDVYAGLARKYLPMFRRCLLPPYSGSGGPSLEASLTVYQSACRRLCPGSLRPLVAGVSPRRPGFYPRPFHDTLTGFIRVLRF